MSILNTYSLCNFKTSYSMQISMGQPKALEKESPLASSITHADLEFSITNNIFVRTLSLHPFYQRTSDLFLPGFIYEILGRPRNSFNHFNSSLLSSSFFFSIFALKSKCTQNLLVILCSTSLPFPGLFGRYFSTFFTYL